MSSSNQPTPGEHQVQDGPRGHRDGSDGAPLDTRGAANGTDVHEARGGVVPSHESTGADGQGRGARGMSVPANEYQPHAQSTGHWEYFPASPQDAQRHQQVLKSTDASLILGILSVTVLPLLGPFAVWQASQAEKLGGRATVGKILGWVGVAVLILAVLWFAFIALMWGVVFTELQDQVNTSSHV